MSQPFDRYWSLRMQSADGRLQAALELVSHRGMRGALAENVLRELIQSFLPKRWVAATGFVVNSLKEASRQVDIVLFDQLNAAALYHDEVVCVIAAGSKPVAIEVKSNLTKETLFDSFANIASIRHIDPTARGSIFALRGMTEDSLKVNLTEALANRDDATASELPDMICVMDRALVVRRVQTRADEVPDRPSFVCHKSVSAVFWSLLAQVLNDLQVESLKALLPEPDVADVRFYI